MNQFFKRNRSSFLLLVLIILLTFLVLLITVPKAKPLLGFATSQKTDTMNKEVIHYVALGDSLTEGVGDATDSGGFVPLVARELEHTNRLNAVQTTNAGKSGDRSDQILKRLKNSKSIQNDLQSADIITVTVGGNDLMKVIKNDALHLTQKSFEKPLSSYKKEVTKLFSELRKYNETAPIYVLGIYNPFYLYFPEITEMQQIVTMWNEGTEEVVKAEKNAYFVPINDLLYKGSGGEVGIVSNSEASSEEKSIKNDALYEEDHFHPNNLGYQLMANAVCDKMEATKDKWLPKE